MRFIHHVQFNRVERATIQRANVHIRIAFPDDATGEEAEVGDKVRRTLNAIVQGDTVNVDRLRRVHGGLLALAQVCDEQSGRLYWERELRPEQIKTGERSGNRVVMGTGVGVIAPGADIVGVLAEARQAQARDARAAVDVIQDAIVALVLMERPDGEQERVDTFAAERNRLAHSIAERWRIDPSDPVDDLREQVRALNERASASPRSGEDDDA